MAPEPSGTADLGTVNVVGSGPNGLAAAVVLARAGLTVRVYEGAATPGGGARTTELIESGTWHDVCSAVHPGAKASPFFRQFELDRRIDFVVPEISYAQPRPGRSPVLARADLDETVHGLGAAGESWRRVFGPLTRRFEELIAVTTDNPLLAPKHLATALRFGTIGLRQWQPIRAARALVGDAADLLSGVEAHVNQRLSTISASLTGLTLATYGHVVGWPIPIGGSRSIVSALVDDLMQHGGELYLGDSICALGDLPPADATFFDTSVESMIKIAGEQLPASYRRQAAFFRTGPGVGKVDFIVSEPPPWSDPELNQASTIHLGGSRADLARAELAVSRGQLPDRPVVIASVPSQFDPGRTRNGQHVVWAYTHLPAGSDLDPTSMITNEIERYAPGFRDTIVASTAHSPRQLADYNPNYVGGDIYAGQLSTRQILARPILAANPWRVGRTDLYLCSSAAVPGPGVHGMGGYRAALTALHHTFGRPASPPNLGLPT